MSDQGTMGADAVKISFIGDEISEAVERIRKRERGLPDFAVQRIEEAIRKLEHTSQELSVSICTAWFCEK